MLLPALHLSVYMCMHLACIYTCVYVHTHAHGYGDQKGSFLDALHLPAAFAYYWQEECVG